MASFFAVNGENEFAPMVNIEVSNGEAFVGGFMSRPALIEGETSGTAAGTTAVHRHISDRGAAGR